MFPTLQHSSMRTLGHMCKIAMFTVLSATGGSPANPVSVWRIQKKKNQCDPCRALNHYFVGTCMPIAPAPTHLFPNPPLCVYSKFEMKIQRQLVSYACPTQKHLQKQYITSIPKCFLSKCSNYSYSTLLNFYCI